MSCQQLVTDIMQNPNDYVDDPRPLVRDFCAALVASRTPLLQADYKGSTWQYCAPPPHSGLPGRPVAVIVDALLGTHYQFETRAIVFLPPLSQGIGREVRFNMGVSPTRSRHQLELVVAPGDMFTEHAHPVTRVQCRSITLMSSPHGWEIVGWIDESKFKYLDGVSSDRRTKLDNMRNIYWKFGDTPMPRVWNPPSDALKVSQYSKSADDPSRKPKDFGHLNITASASASAWCRRSSIYRDKSRLDEGLRPVKFRVKDSFLVLRQYIINKCSTIHGCPRRFPWTR